MQRKSRKHGFNGAKDMDTPRRIHPDKEDRFDNLVSIGYRRTSDEDEFYNCVAWALGDTSQRWDPIKGSGDHWPQNMPCLCDIPTFMSLFQSQGGYVKCDDWKHEEGIEKIVLFEELQHGLFSHVTRELRDGKWTSKLGDWEDIEHNSPEALTGKEYGKISAVMKRPFVASMPD